MANLSDIITPTNVLTDDNTQTVTNKTINGSNNTITNVALTTGVTGTLPVAKGGTNLTALGSAGQVLTVNSGASALEYTTPADEIPSQSGNSGKFLTTNGSAASWGEVSASPTLEAVASGTLDNGDTVIINADGTVTAAGLVSTPVPVIGSTVEFEAGNTSYISSCYDTGSNKVIIAYTDNGDGSRVKAIVGTVANGAITFGTPANIDGNTGNYTSIAYDANANKVVVIYHKTTTNNGIAQVGTVSGTSISFGTENTFSSTEINYNAIRYDSSANKLIIAWYSPGDTAIKVTAGTISGTNMSFGAVASTAAPSNISIGLVYDANANKSLLCYRGPSNYGYAAVISLSGTTASIGTPAVFISESVSDVTAVYDSSNNKTLIIWRKASNNYGAGIVATISGTGVTFGTEAVLASETGFYFGASFDTTVNKSIVAYYNSSSGYNKSVQGTISGTSVTFTSPVTYLSARADYNALAYDPDSERTIFAFNDTGNSDKGTSLLYSSTTQATNLTSENYIGISDAAYSNGATATIQLVGTVDDAQSGLTAGQSYFVQDNGSIALTPATTSVFAGTAIAATKLLIGERSVFDYPSQTGNSGKFLTTDGTVASWGDAGVTILSSIDVTSATTAEFTGIPSGVSVIFLALQNTGDSSATEITVTLGTSSAYKTSGYKSMAMKYRAGTWAQDDKGSAFTLGLDLNTASSARNGMIILTKTSSNYWSLSSNITDYDYGEFHICSGGVDLGAELTKLKVVNEQGNFDTGKIGFSYFQDLL